MQRPTRLQCEREERIAVVQLKAYWDCFPLPVEKNHNEDTPVEETSEEELIEDMGQDHWRNQEPGASDDPNQELVVDKAEPTGTQNPPATKNER